MDKEKADMIIYTTEDGLTRVETTFDGDTVWLSIDQMAELFQRDRSVIGKHVRNVFKKRENILLIYPQKFQLYFNDLIAEIIPIDYLKEGCLNPPSKSSGIAVAFFQPYLE